MKTQQQWKFKTQTIPTALGDGIPSPPFRRKRRHSEPHIQESTNAYKNYVTHWKLPTSTPSNSTNTSTTACSNTKKTTTTTTTNTIHFVDSQALDDLKVTKKQSSQPHVWRPSPVSPTSLSPRVTPPSPHSSDTIQQWKPEPIKSMFHPYKRNPAMTPPSPSTANKLTSTRDRRRNSAPHISYNHVTNSTPLDNRLETIPELSFPSRLHISPPPILAPLGSISASAFPTPLKTCTSISSLNSHKRPYELLQVAVPTSQDSSKYPHASTY
jgi:hypothetical protein